LSGPIDVAFNVCRALDEDEYRVCCAAIGENFSEVGELPQELFHSPEIMAPPPPERHGNGTAAPLPPSWLRVSVHLPDVRLVRRCRLYLWNPS